MTTAAIAVIDLSKAFGGIRVLDKISFEVAPGEIFAYLGPNGAGKTTTIKILAGLLPRDGGEVRICGRDIAADPVEVKKRIGVVPEESNLYPELTCRRNLDYLAELYGLRRQQRRQKVEEILSLLALKERAGEPFGVLSRGLKRRLTIAAALLHDPEVLLLDEPTTGLDVPSARALRQLIRDISRQGVTIFLTTHNLQEAEELCRRLVIILKGRIVASGTPTAIRQQIQRLLLLQVTFQGEVAPEELVQACPAIKSLQRKNEGWQLEVTSIQEALEQLAAFTRQRQVAITAINTLVPTLEDAFLKLVQER